MRNLVVDKVAGLISSVVLKFWELRTYTMQLERSHPVVYWFYIFTLLYTYTGSSKKMDGIWNRYNLKITRRIYTFGVLKC